MIKKTLILLVCAIQLGLAMTAKAMSAAEELQQELDGFSSLTASFEQRVINQDLQLVDVLTGQFFLKRPGLFKWKYADDEQDIVSDGKQIHFIMRDLEQVIQRDFSTAIATVPSLILVTDSSKLSELFAIEKLSGMPRGQVFQLLPKSLDSNYESVTVSFLSGKLLGLRLIDVLGQTTEIILSGTQNNPTIPDSEFQVTIPEGFDVVQG